MSRPESVSRRGLLGAAAGLSLAATAALADDPPAKTSPAPPAKPEDVASLDAVLAALYDVISGDKGAERDWGRFKSLFVPGARLIPCLPKNAEGRVGLRVLSPDQFAELAKAASARRGFYEREIARKVDRFGHVAHVFSTYESSETKGGAPFARGINSFQFFFDEKRWWVVTIFWDAETPEQPIPAEYEAKGKK